MSKKQEPKRQRKPVNLTLSEDTIKRAEKLKVTLNRPSISNLFEHLVLQATEQKQAA